MLTHKYVFDYREDDVYACVADIGWITGHSYVVYGPLANGATTVLFESIPTYPDAGRYWDMVERLKITQFYTAQPRFVQLLEWEIVLLRNMIVPLCAFLVAWVSLLIRRVGIGIIKW